MERRRLLGLAGGAAAWALSGGRASAATREIPDETPGPFPGDGSNGGPNVLNRRGIVRRDIRPSFGGARGRARGVELTVRMTVSRDGVPLRGAAVYVWQCDREAKYSLYDPGVRGENYLRGVQVADTDGVVEFLSVFPGVYPGRWPHLHFDVYPDLRTARRSGGPIKTSQLALPEDACAEVYASPGYADSARNLSRISLETDGVFRDGHDAQLATTSGSPRDGYVATLDVPV
ncbi:MAG: dioxygenase family protein [Sporichthyaceae bacterium]